MGLRPFPLAVEWPLAGFGLGTVHNPLAADLMYRPQHGAPS